MKETVLGEFQSIRAARVARETIAGLLKASYDLTTDSYAVNVDGERGLLVIRELSRGNVQHVLEIGGEVSKAVPR